MVEIYGHVHGKALKFLVIGIVVLIRYFYRSSIWRYFRIFGGRVDDVMQRILEIIASIPNLIVVILFVLIFEPSIWIIIAMSITGWLGMSRVVRGEFLKLKTRICNGIKNIGRI